MNTASLRSAYRVFLVTLVCCAPAWAAPVTWIGGNANWVDGNANNANWNPADEPDTDDEAIFNASNTVNLGSDNSIQALTMSGGIDLSMNGHELTVDGLVQLVDANTNLIVEGAGSEVDADSITVNSGGVIQLNGLLSVNEESGDGLLDINAGGTISGSGTMHLGDFVAAGTVLLTNDGTISAFAPIPFVGATPPVRTLAINASDTADALIDLDGASGNGVLNVFRNQRLDINVIVTDQISGDINLFHNSTLDMSHAWFLDSGTIDIETGFVDNPFPASDVPADVAYIRGAVLTQTGGTITLVDIDGTLQFDAAFLMNGGSLVNNGLVVFNANNTIIATPANFTMPTSASSITVAAGVTVNVDQPNFDADGGGSATNVLTVNSGAVLDLDLGAGADESLGGFLQLNGGELDVTTADTDWAINGNVSVGPNTGTSQINGHEVAFTTGAAVVVGANSTLQVNAANVWEASASLVTNSGSVARLNGNTTFNGGSFTGSGTLMTAGITTFDSATTINMPSGTVILDGDDVIGGAVTINADTTIHAGTMANFGNDNVIGFNTLVLNDLARLNVRITDLEAEWTLTSDAVLDINASASDPEGSGVDGSDFNMAGSATISGNSLWTARADISGTMSIAATGDLTLNGGSRLDPNRLEGGMIIGPGTLSAGNVQALHGFGTINTDIDFDGDAELFADDGTLTLTGDILDVRLIGTFDDDAILEVTNPWNSIVATQVVLQGGELRGGQITNDGLIVGTADSTLISARVINNLQIAAIGGNLTLQTAANDNDWDGAMDTGQLNAFDGNILLRDDANFDYRGTIFIGSGNQVYAAGFALHLEPGSLLDLTGGKFRHTTGRVSEIGGAVVVHAGADSMLATDESLGGFRLESTSTVNLIGNLQLDNASTIVEAGATFSGTGRLINLAGRSLEPEHQADINVIVENQGVYSNSDLFVGRNDMLQFVQTVTGTFVVDLQGTATSQYDRLRVDGAAQLAGSLQMMLGGGYVPALGNTLDIIAAVGGVTGTFSNVVQPAGMPAGLRFDVIYSPTLVQLAVVAIPSLAGDYNQNGVVDAADYVLWRKNTGTTNILPNDPIGGTIGPAQYAQWRANFGRTAGPGASSRASIAAPEPHSVLLVIGASASLLQRLRWRRDAKRRQLIPVISEVSPTDSPFRVPRLLKMCMSTS